jgi:hypothetical protein
MNDRIEVAADSKVPRRRFLGLFGGLLGGLGALGLLRWSHASDQPQPTGRDRPLKEADFYRPHDLAG